MNTKKNKTGKDKKKKKKMNTGSTIQQVVKVCFRKSRL